VRFPFPVADLLQLNAGSPSPRHQIARRINDAYWTGLAAMRMGAAMMRLSDLHLTPARTGLIVVAAFLLCAIIVRVITVSEHSEVRAHEVGSQSTLDVGVADLRGSLP
jgi:hypothetical protein